MAIASQTLQTKGFRTRTGGSAFTVFTWQHNIIAFGRQISTVSPTPVGTGATPIHPMDVPYPIEIITPAAQNIGTITVELWELYNQKVWERLAGLAQAVDLVNIFIRVASFGVGGISVSKIIRPPVLQGVSPVDPVDTNTIAAGSTPYAEVYNNVVIVNVEDGETIEVGTMDISKRLTLAYTNISIVSPEGVSYPNTAISLAGRNVAGTSA